jgi:AGZA family xanthine/uracil permease-like MFS transporter
MKEELQGELDGFFGLFIDNLLQFILIFVLCHNVCGMPRDFIYGTILPGAAFSILLGNVFYAYQARSLALSTGRTDVTALPYGINTVSLIAFIFLIALPVYLIEKDWERAWRVSLIGCLGSGCLELLGAFVGDQIRRMTPRGALLSSLAGIALTFISMGFVFRIFSFPLIAMVPALIIVVGYSARISLPARIPVGLGAVVLGGVMYWLLYFQGWQPLVSLNSELALGFYLPKLCLAEIFQEIRSLKLETFVSVVVPMGLFNVIGSLQNLESAEASGDCFKTSSSLAVNGLGTIVAALFGSPFPTTIYIGHPGWKAMGARWRYSAWNGLAIAILTLFGAVSIFLVVIPLECMLGILLWIGVVMVVQAFRDVPKSDYSGVVVGLIPSLAAWALMLMEATARASGKSLVSLSVDLQKQDIFLDGIIALNQGFIISSSVLAAIVIYASRTQYLYAAYWSLAGGVLSWFGVIHGFRLSSSGISYAYEWGSAPRFALAYTCLALFFFLLVRTESSNSD